jgi:hypothetical protein
MDTCPDEPEDELESFFAELHRFRTERLRLFREDRAAWDEQNRQMAEQSKRRGYTVSFCKKDPDCVPDNYRYADLCPPGTFPIDEEA